MKYNFMRHDPLNTKNLQISRLRTVHDTKLQIVKQLRVAAHGQKNDLVACQRATGVKDKFAERHFQSYIDEIRTLRGADKKAHLSRIPRWVESKKIEILSPTLTIEGGVCELHGDILFPDVLQNSIQIVIPLQSCCISVFLDMSNMDGFSLIKNGINERSRCIRLGLIQQTYRVSISPGTLFGQVILSLTPTRWLDSNSNSSFKQSHFTFMD
jgi:hypothetical protein